MLDMDLPKWWNQKMRSDYILTDKHGIFSDLSVHSSINTGSDHRMVWGRPQINTRLERPKLAMQPKKIDTNKLKKHQVKFEAELQNRFSMLDYIPQDDLDATADTITKTYTWNNSPDSRPISGWEARQVINQDKNAKRRREDLWSRDGTTRDYLEYIQTCKAIREGMKDNIQAFNEKQVLEAIEKNKSLKHARHKQCIGKNQVISIMDVQKELQPICSFRDEITIINGISMIGRRIIPLSLQKSTETDAPKSYG